MWPEETRDIVLWCLHSIFRYVEPFRRDSGVRADTETDILVANAELNLTMMPGQKVEVDSIRFPNFAFEYLVTDYTEILRTEHLKAA